MMKCRAGVIMQTYPLDDINVGDQAMRDNENIRGVIVHAEA
jgi:Zn-dependent alcohol dehydrogenase